MRFVTVLLLLGATAVLAQDTAKGKSYLCIADKSTGFTFNESTASWDQTNFRVDDNKYLVRPAKPDDDLVFASRETFVYGVWRLGEDKVMIECDHAPNEYHWLRCNRSSESFTLNTKSNRFMLTFRGSYLVSTFTPGVADSSGEDRGGDTPFIEIGKCSPL